MANGKAPSERRRTRDLIHEIGGPTIVAKWLNVTPQAVSLWLRVPARHVRRLSALGKVSRVKIRPDLYGPGH